MDYGDFFTDYQRESEDAIHDEQGEFSKKEMHFIMGSNRF